MKRTSFGGVSLKGLVGLHRSVQLQLLQHYSLGHRLGWLWYWMVCLGNEQRMLIAPHKIWLCCTWVVFCFFFLIFIFTLFHFTILYLFCHTLTWIHHGCTWVPKHEPPFHLPPHIISLHHPHAPAPSILYPASNIDWRFISYMTFSQIIPPSPSPPESKSPLYTSVSFLLSCIQGHHYHLSKFHIYVLVYCIGVFLSGLLHSV